MLKFLQKGSGEGARDERLRAAFAAAPAGLALAGLDGRLLLFNDMAAQLLGYTRDDLSRTSLIDITHPDDVQRELAFLKKMAVGEVTRYQIDKRVADKHGRYRAIVASAALVRRKGDPDAAVYVLQTGQQKGGSGATADGVSNAILDGLAGVAVVRCDAQGVIFGWNRGAEEMFGYTRDEITRKNRRILYRRDANWSATANEHLTLAGDHGLIEMEDRRLTRDGRELWLRVTLTPFAPDGTVRGYVEVFQPVVQPAALHESTIAELREDLVRERAAGDTLARVVEKLKARRVELEQELAAMEKRVVRSETSEAAAAAWTPFDQQNALDLVEEMARAGRTGLMLFVSEERQKSIQLEQGRIASCASNDDEQTLGERLVREGVITGTQRDRALEMAGETNIALGRALVLLETLAEEVVVIALRAKLANELADLETWTSGRWAFVEREQPRDKPVRISVGLEDARGAETE